MAVVQVYICCNTCLILGMPTFYDANIQYFL